jgi:uncharacterized membrane protein YcaP (DUF421 family)
LLSGRPARRPENVMTLLGSLFHVDVQKMFSLDVSVLEMFGRGTLTYLGIFVILRMFRRPTGQLSVADVLLITIIADAAQNSMAGEYASVSSGFVLIGTIVFWDRLIDHLSYRYAWFAKVATPRPVPLIRDGVPIRPALEAQEISDDDLLSHLRQHGVELPDQARLCMLESDGKISVLKKKDS